MRRRYRIGLSIIGAAVGCGLTQCAAPSPEFHEAYHRCRQVQPGMTRAEMERQCGIVRHYAGIDVDLALAAVSTRGSGAGATTRYWYRYDPPFLIGDVHVSLNASGLVTSVQD